MRLIFLLLAMTFGPVIAEAAPRCLPAKSCKSRQQCLDESANKWRCVSVLPAKPGKGGGGGRELTPREREALERGSGRSRLGDCTRRTCDQREIDDAWDRANGGRGNDGGLGGGCSSARDGNGMSECEQRDLEDAAARRDRDEAERRRRLGRD
jgi:hypothetical protein